MNTTPHKSIASILQDLIRDGMTASHEEAYFITDMKGIPLHTFPLTKDGADITMTVIKAREDQPVQLLRYKTKAEFELLEITNG